MKKLLFTTTAVLAVTFGALINYQPKIDANFDELGVQQELANHGETLDNHEDRISNTEKDVKEVQEKTSTPASIERVVVREVVTPRAEQKVTPKPKPIEESEPTPEPKIVVSSYQVITLENGEDKDCKWIFSDGTNWLRKHVRIEYNQGTKITRISGMCDESLIGRDKPASTTAY